MSGECKHEFGEWETMAQGIEGMRQRRECALCGEGQRRVIWYFSDDLPEDAPAKVALAKWLEETLQREFDGEPQDEVPRGIL
jgi:hypothetical protein